MSGPKHQNFTSGDFSYLFKKAFKKIDKKIFEMSLDHIIQVIERQSIALDT